MPNWCTNRLYLTHPDQAMMDRAIAALQAPEPKFFNEFIPIPKDLMITAGWFKKDTPEQKELEEKENANLKKHGYRNWYDFCTSEWGVKWDVAYVDFEVDSTNQLIVNFDTAWGPAIPAMDKLTNMGFYINLYYIEYGMGFCGHYDSETGDECYDISECPDFINEELNIGEEIARNQEEA